jgi:hypothetical protein
MGFVNEAISKYVFVIAHRRFNDGISSVGQIRHDVVREVMTKLGVENGVQVTTLAGIPAADTGLEWYYSDRTTQFRRMTGFDHFAFFEDPSACKNNAIATDRLLFL